MLCLTVLFNCEFFKKYFGKLFIVWYVIEIINFDKGQVSSLFVCQTAYIFCRPSLSDNLPFESHAFRCGRIIHKQGDVSWDISKYVCVCVQPLRRQLQCTFKTVIHIPILTMGMGIGLWYLCLLAYELWFPIAMSIKNLTQIVLTVNLFSDAHFPTCLYNSQCTWELHMQ